MPVLIHPKSIVFYPAGEKMAKQEEKSSLDYGEVYLWEYFCHFVTWSTVAETALYKHLHTVGGAGGGGEESHYVN